MKVRNFWILSLLVTSIIAWASYKDPQRKFPLDFATNGLSCGAVQHTPGKKSSISFYIENVIVEDNSVLKDLKIPFAVFKYTDIAFYDNFPIPNIYKHSYETKEELYNGLVDFDTNRFITEKYNIDLEEVLGSPNVYTDYVMYDVEGNAKSHIQFEVEKSGSYCVYIAPPLDKGIRELSIPVQYMNSYGYLPIREYKEYFLSKCSFLFGMALVSYVTYFFLRLKFTRNNTNTNNADFISKCIIFYVFIPILCLHILQISLSGLKNSFYLSVKYSKVSHFLENFFVWVRGCLYIIIWHCFILLLSMGVGVIYNFRESSVYFSKLPSGLQERATLLLFFNLFVMSMDHLVMLQERKSIYPFFDTHESSGLDDKYFAHTPIFLLCLIVTVIKNIMGIVWLFHIISSYISTKKAVAKFPAFEGIGVSKEITKSFRSSLLIIYVLPFFFSMMESIVTRIMIKSNANSLENTSVSKDKINLWKFNIIKLVVSDEIHEYNTFSIKDTFLSEYITIVCIVFIWINTSKYLFKKENTRNALSLSDGEKI